VAFEDIAEGLKKFEGISRRFEIKGEVNDVLVLDDYGHHPAEVATTLAAASSRWDRRLVVLFQPHRYTRTQKLADEFGHAFFDAEVLVVAGVYAASEEPIEGVSGALIANAANRFGHRNAEYIENREELLEHVLSIVEPGDVVVTLGAGDIYRLGEQVLERLKERGTK